MPSKVTRALVPAALLTSLASPVGFAAPAQAAPAPATAVGAPIASSATAAVTAARTAAPTTVRAAALGTRNLQIRLMWAGMEPGKLDGVWGPATRAAVLRFQRKFKLPATGRADDATWTALLARTKHGYGIKPECRRKAKAICVDKTLRLVRVLEKGVLLYSMDARFGPRHMATREGAFSVGRKGDDYNKDGQVSFEEAEKYVSRDLGLSMPLPLFFYRGQAIHYSPTFARDGYAGASSGCANVRDYAKQVKLWNWASVYTPVYVYSHSAL